MNNYIERFLKLKCSGDILGVLNPINNCSKEISETMGIIKYLKSITLKEPLKYTIYDICAGNALTSVTASHLLPIKHSYAIDIKSRNRKWNLIKKFNYINKNIYDNIDFVEDSIIIGLHTCGNLAYRLIDLYNDNPNVKYILLMPCCIGNINTSLPEFFRKYLGKYRIWSYNLSEKINNSKVSLVEDKNIISPCNIIIKGEKL